MLDKKSLLRKKWRKVISVVLILRFDVNEGHSPLRHIPFTPEHNLGKILVDLKKPDGNETAELRWNLRE